MFVNYVAYWVKDGIEMKVTGLYLEKVAHIWFEMLKYTLITVKHSVVVFNLLFNSYYRVSEVSVA